MLLSSSVWRDNARWWFSGGLLLGGLTTAAVAVVVGSLVRPVVPTVLAAMLMGGLFLVVAGQEFGLYRLRLPQNARQVPQTIVTADSRYGPLQFGFEMGTGVRTYMTSGLPHILVLGLLLLVPWDVALVSGIAFGGGRAWMALSRLWHGDVDAWDYAQRRYDRLTRIVLTVGTGALLVAILLIAGR
ncbi:hypothetical protein ACPXB5_13030 [Micromonospora arida]|uniref:Uncharacterized protein n=1 Tax=Micromonospora arida TaxID=2203715 RepID=A0A3N9WSR5_9ACTN|nr:hypothetical protein [Micromonospora arida]RQX03908.1 hypothetical protein DLJ58_29045 [Micromonospora arida]